MRRLLRRRPGGSGSIGLGTAAFLSLLRPHIVLIAALAAACFGFLFDGRANWSAAGWSGFDWLLLNFWNRLADGREDELNAVPGAGFAARHLRVLFWLALLVAGASFLASAKLGFWFNCLRAGFQGLGFLYNFRILPRGVRLKDVLGLKNLSAGALFLVSDVGYPLALRAGFRPVAVQEVLFLSGFFLCLEMTYELLYDLRDASGDAAAGLTTVPVRFGAEGTRRVAWALLAASAVSLCVGFGLSWLSFAEMSLIAAPLQQALVLQFWFRRRVSPSGAIAVTYLGAAQLASFLLWTGFGLPLHPGPWLRT